MARMTAIQKAECRVFIREIREIRGSIPLVAAGRVGVGGLFWWCFQVLLFDHLGFFSSIGIVISSLSHGLEYDNTIN